MSWLRRSSGNPGSAPRELATRLTTTARIPLRVKEETASLSDGETVRRWIRTLRPEGNQQVHVHRAWGTVAAVCDGKHPVNVVLTDGEHAWVAEPPGGPTTTRAGFADMSLEQVEHVVMDALTSTDRPQWPTWRSVT